MKRGHVLILASLLGSPAAWAAHFFGGYVIVVLWCAQGWSGMSGAMMLLTAAGVALAAASGILAFRLWRQSSEDLHTDAEPGKPGPWDARMGERGAREVFLAVLSMLLAMLFGFLILMQGLTPMLVPSCPPMVGP